MARFNDNWTNVNNQVLMHLDLMKVHLVFHLSVGMHGSGWSALSCEADWISALAHMRKRVATACTLSGSQHLNQ